MFSDEIIKLVTETLQLAKSNGHHISTAESCTGGLIIAALTDIAGSSDVVDRGFITYTNNAKNEMLDVSNKILKKHGAVSSQVAIAMVQGAIKHSNSTIAVSVTGIAGPGGGSEHKPVGLVHMAAMKQGSDPIHEEYKFGNIGRNQIRESTIIAALELLKRII